MSMLKRLNEMDFYKPASFLASVVRKYGVRRFLFAATTKQSGTTTTVFGIARVLANTHGLRVLAIQLNPVGKGFSALLKKKVGIYVYKGDNKVTPDEIPLNEDGFRMLTIKGKEKHKDSSAITPILLKKALLELDQLFDVVLVDSPSLLDNSETLSSAHEVDGLVVIIESGHTRQEVLSQVRKIADIEDISLLGSIMTKQKHFIPGWIYRLLFN